MRAPWKSSNNLKAIMPPEKFRDAVAIIPNVPAPGGAKSNDATMPTATAA